MPTAATLNGGVCRLSACLPTAAGCPNVERRLRYVRPFIGSPPGGNDPVCLCQVSTPDAVIERKAIGQAHFFSGLAVVLAEARCSVVKDFADGGCCVVVAPRPQGSFVPVLRNRTRPMFLPIGSISARQCFSSFSENVYASLRIVRCRVPTPWARTTSARLKGSQRNPRSRGLPASIGNLSGTGRCGRAPENSSGLVFPMPSVSAGAKIPH